MSASGREVPCRSPRRARLWLHVLLVLAQVSSMKTRRAGSSRPWYFFHCARRRSTSGRSCSVACRLFFKLMPSYSNKCRAASS